MEELRCHGKRPVFVMKGVELPSVRQIHRCCHLEWSLIWVILVNWLNRVCGVAKAGPLAAQILNLEAMDIAKQPTTSDSVYIWLMLPLLLTLATRQVQFQAQLACQDRCWWLS